MEAGDNEWLVSDSEDEYTFPPGGIGFRDWGLNHSSTDNLKSTETSTIHTAIFSPDHPRTPQRGDAAGESLFTPPQGEVNPTIDNFPSPSCVPELAATRPRPRVVMKQPKTSRDGASVASTSFSHISDPSIPTTRATDESVQSATAASFDFPETTGDAYSSLNIADRAKMRSRKSQTAKKLVYRPVDSVEVIELTSDDDEISLKPTKHQKQDKPPPKPKAQPKARPKPTLKVKAAAALSHDSQLSGIVILDPPVPSPKPASSSQLPASTMPTIPPSTPLQAHKPTPPSSPVIITRKRKRFRSFIPDYDDGMDVGGDIPQGASPPIPEPLPFFAPSTSSVLISESGVEIPHLTEGSINRGRMEQVPSSKKTRAQTKTQSKGKKGKGKKLDDDDFAEGAAEGARRIAQEPSAQATLDGPELAEEQASSIAITSKAIKKVSANPSGNKKGKAKVIASDEEEEERVQPQRSGASPPKRKHLGTGAVDTPAIDEGKAERSKKNRRTDNPSPLEQESPPQATPASTCQPRGFSVKPNLTPMSELIRRVNSQPNSPFSNASRPYSPFLKSSRTMLSRIAPLHPNRRTPPPPLPRPPPPKKSKKQIQMEEKIEEELAETVEGWSCMTDEERRDLRRARIDAELGYE
ncbi:hypothetical protein BS17DRAFT_880332 [Gyrodon lividus]|nr:hypothetical protein BS17DRAFT_880332 [Gyrodon lividus]